MCQVYLESGSLAAFLTTLGTGHIVPADVLVIIQIVIANLQFRLQSSFKKRIVKKIRVDLKEASVSETV